MRKSEKITHTKEYHQLNSILHDGFLRDIDFSQCYKHVRFIVECHEHLDSSPTEDKTGIYFFDFKRVRSFSLNFSEKMFDEENRIPITINTMPLPWLKEYTQECTNEKRKFYRLVLDNSWCSLEIHFDVLDVYWMCGSGDIPGWGFFTPNERKEFYDILEYKYKKNESL